MDFNKRSGNRQDFLRAGILVWLVSIVCAPSIQAQWFKKLQANGQIKEGNKKYEDHKFSLSEKSYKEALKNNPESFSGNFNMGDAMYSQNKYIAATEYYKKATETAGTKKELESSYYNLGNSFLKQGEPEPAISAYKNALKLNPDNLYAKANLSYARTLKKQKQQPKPQQNSGQAKPKPGENPDDKNKQPDGNDKKEDLKAQNNKQDKDQISEAEAEQIMDALKHDEQNIRQRMYDQKRRQKRYKTDKPW